MDQKIKELADSFFEWPTENKSFVTLTSAILFAEKIARITKEGSNARINDLDQIAQVCHEVQRAYCAALGDMSLPTWEDAPGWQKKTVLMGVRLHLGGDHGAEASHASWMKQKLEEGWIYGEVKDPAAKTHPCMVPFAELPKEQQAKDFIFRAVVHALASVV